MKIVELFEDIGPHEGKELELMLNGSKPAALINNDRVNDFKKYLKNKTLSLVEKIPRREPSRYYSVVITKPGEEWRGKEIANSILGLRQVPQDSEEAIKYHEKLGNLLGYSSNDIDHFVSRIRARMIQNNKIN